MILIGSKNITSIGINLINWKDALYMWWRELRCSKMGLLKRKWKQIEWKNRRRRTEWTIEVVERRHKALIGPSHRGLCRCLQTEYLNVSVICDTWRLVCRSLESSAISRVTREEPDSRSHCVRSAPSAAARFSVRDNMEHIILYVRRVKQIEHEHSHLTPLWGLRTN